MGGSIRIVRNPSWRPAEARRRRLESRWPAQESFPAEKSFGHEIAGTEERHGVSVIKKAGPKDKSLSKSTVSGVRRTRTP